MQDTIITIRTLECDVCKRFDSVMLTKAEIEARISANNVDVAAYSIPHQEHTRIIYFDETGQYLGDTIAFPDDELPEIAKTESIPFYVINRKNTNLFHRLRELITTKFTTNNLSLTITGPSRAGKTSLVRYLRTLVPERETGPITSVPTMGKSTKQVTLGNSTITTMDMGGQQDFWGLWEAPIHQSDAIIFIVDGTSNNQLEISNAFERIIEYREDNKPILVMVNKKDLLLRGNAVKFSTTGEFLSLTRVSLPLPNIRAIETSIFEGIAYIDNEELPIAEVLSSFFQEFC